MRSFSLFSVNIQGLVSKIDKILNFLHDEDFHILCFCEHFVTDVDVLKMVKLSNFQLASSFCRRSTTRGGVAIFTRVGFECHCIDLNSFTVDIHAEFCAVNIVSLNTIVVNVYRSGSVGDFEIFYSKLEQVLSHVHGRSRKLCIVGDFNVNFNSLDDEATRLLCLLLSFNLHRTVFESTRVTRLSSSCIDNIFVNLPMDSYNSAIVEPCFSDHYALTVEVFCYWTLTPPVTYGRVINSYGLVQFREYLQSVNWDIFNIPHYTSDMQSSIFVEALASGIELCFPVKPIKRGQKELVSWYSDHLRNARDRVLLAKAAYRATNDLEHLQIYNNLNKSYKAELRSARRAAYNNYILGSGSVGKNCWNVINYERNKSSRLSSTGISPDIFNEYFSGIADTILNELQPSKKSSLNYLKSIDTRNSIFFLNPVTEREVESIIAGLSNSGCLDCYDMNSKLLKFTFDILLSPLTKLINNIFAEGVYPEAFKIGKVIPLHKSGKSKAVDNFRPITILPVVSKVVESALKSRLVDYFERNRLFSNSQFGYRSGRSTADALRSFLESVVDGLDRNLLSSATCCDLAKAFDCVSHSLLIDKLEFYGIRGPPLSLLKSYLSDRVQYVHVDNRGSSAPLSVRHGVPQGSILGPLLFIIFINDLPLSIPSEGTLMFADDTAFIFNARNATELAEKRASINNAASDWFLANKLKLNLEKTQLVTFSASKTVNLFRDSVSLLGVKFDSLLNWQCHISVLHPKLGSVLYLLRHLSGLVSPSVLRTAYFGTFHCHLVYGVTLWGNSVDSNKIFVLQKAALRIMARAITGCHCQPLFKQFSIMPLPCIYMYFSLLTIHKQRQNYQTHADVHSYPTRSARNLVPLRSRIACAAENKLDFSLFNALPHDIRNKPHNLFKNAVKKMFLSNCFYSKPEYYAYVSGL